MKEQMLSDKIFSVTSCPDASDLLSYSKGELQDDIALSIEKHITDCPLCSDAIEGLLLISGTEVLEEVREQNNYSNDFDFKQHKNRELKIIISASVLVIISFIILYFNKPTHDKQIVTKEISSTTSHKTIKNSQPVQLFRHKEEIIPKQIVSENEIKTNPVAIVFDSVTSTYNYAAKTDSNLLSTANENSVVANNNKEKINPILSSGLPVVYIHELKAIDYTSIYDELQRKKGVLLKSVEAQYQNTKSMETAKQNQASSYDTLIYSKLLSDALLAYHDEKYVTSQLAFEKILSIYPDDQNALFYGGLSSYQLDKPELAIQQLEKILAHRQSPFNEEAKWNLALSYHQNKQDDLCKQWLEKIMSDKGFYEEKAKEFLQELK